MVLVIKAGGNAIAFEMDVRDENMVQHAVRMGVNHFISKRQGLNLDVLVNNAGALSLLSTEDISMKR